MNLPSFLDPWAAGAVVVLAAGAASWATLLRRRSAAPPETPPTWAESRAELVGDVALSGSVTFPEDLHVRGDLTLMEGTHVRGNVTVEGDAHLSADSHLEGDLDVMGGLRMDRASFVGATTVTKEAVVAADACVDGPLSCERLLIAPATSPPLVDLRLDGEDASTPTAS